MAQETKVGLLIGLALILLVGLVLSDLFTGGPAEPVPTNTPTDFGREAQAGIYEDPDSPANPATTTSATPRGESGLNARASIDRPGDLRGSDFRAEPAQPYRRVETPAAAPAESWSPSSPRDVAPQHTVEPPLPELDTLEARDAVARFNDSLEAMRLAVQNPVDAQRRLTEAATTPPRVAPLKLPDPAGSTTAAPSAANETRALLASGGTGGTAGTGGTGGTTYIHYVQGGQSLADIARQHYGNPEFAAAIAQTNPTKVDRDGQVRAGARLEIPPLGSPVFSRLFEPVHAPHAARIDIPMLPDRPAGPTATNPPAEVASAAVASPSTKTIEVQPGDTLSQLAADHLGTATRWKEFLEANPDQLPSDQSLRSGMTLRLPINSRSNSASSGPPASAVSQTPDPKPQTPIHTYTVQAGDNLTNIARRLLDDGERWDDLLAANADQLDAPENLRAGMVLKLPNAPENIAPQPAEPVRITTRSPDPGPRSPATKTYVVEAGDNLTRIARSQLGDGDRWRELFETNADQLESPDDLYAGQTLRLP